ncbi:MAG: filamentous hemagglutinin N-terminal domain-containing protein [Nitrospira sp.]|nr:filamentous hemagglutinin N-terminal domain-containing protein [Nitrospira sp.]MBH0182731.1 filamentous hemagglutinin N-terminal domain-containing protein [Nitrospira sp.]MBH0184982.1 filamentous hemagglutinin N-terminal domain-containing protein [Nitrospira sp.]
MRRMYGALGFSQVFNRCITIPLALLAWGLLNSPSIAIAQTAPITPAGLNTQVSDPIAVDGQTQYDITGGTRPGGESGTTLFHSFDTFGVPADNIANFLNGVSYDLDGNPLAAGLSTSTILARVTGEARSDIYGTIQTTGFGNVNLFLMNPNGFLFGPGATINIGGMAHFTTADYLRLSGPGGGSASIFHADLAEASILTTAPVAAFGFIGSYPAAIQVAGSQLILANGTGLSLIGGDVSIGADQATGTPTFISAPSGTIDLVSVASPGEILYPSLQTGPNIHGQTVTAKGTVSISDFSLLDVSGITGEGTEAGGAVRIRGGQFVMDNLSLILNMTKGNTAGANSGVSVTVDHDVRLTNLSMISVGTGTGLGRSGNLDVSAENVAILSGSSLTSTSDGPAAPGDITISATQSLTLAGLDPFSETEGSGISTTAQSSVEGGNVTIDSAGSTLSIQDNAFIVTQSNTGRAGNITMNSDVLQVTDGGAVKTGSSFGLSGTIIISANDSVVISGQSASGNISTIENSSHTTPANIAITTGQFVLADHATIDGDTASQQGGTVTITATQSINLSGNSTIRSSTSEGTGTSLELSAPTIAINQSTLSTRIGGSNPDNVGGTIRATATTGDLTISNNSLIAASTAGATEGGSIELRASDSVHVTANSRIESTSTGTGNAGNIEIDAGQNFTATDSTVTTEATQSGGGTIKITTDPSGTVQLTNSTISASVLNGTGGGGSVNIDPQFVILVNSHILGTAIQGAGGNIFITTNLLLLDGNSTISASSQFGQSGTVTIQTPNAPISGQIHPLGKTPLLATSLLHQQCASVAGGQFSSFTVAGRDSVPTEPGSWLMSPLDADGMEPRLKVEGGKAEGLSRLSGVSDVVRAGLAAHQINQTDQIDKTDQSPVSLRQIAPAGFLTRAFAVDRSAGCTS